MVNCFNGLSNLNIELTSRCNKSCWMCGRRKLEKESPNKINWGNIDFSLLEKIKREIPENIVIQFHNNGESLLYPRFGEAIKLFKNQIKTIDTNGKLLLEKSDEIINNLDTLTISIFQDDPESEEQYNIVKEFINIKKDRKPFLIYRCLGYINKERWEKLPGIVVSRNLHSPYGSFSYQKKPTIPEIGICLDILSHLVIDRFGYVYPCVRLDPNRLNCIGDINKENLLNIWNGELRKRYLKYHINGEREKVPLCKKCEYWGVPTGE